ncbi:hypothetical protein N431DRAFT_525666 [Stipitochalara longipes BDJ]|nr:hypothetical protein N431DRAFT_525666 [Stipitochalara longipes BDJ]
MEQSRLCDLYNAPEEDCECKEICGTRHDSCPDHAISSRILSRELSARLSTPTNEHQGFAVRTLAKYIKYNEFMSICLALSTSTLTRVLKDYRKAVLERGFSHRDDVVVREFRRIIELANRGTYVEEVDIYKMARDMVGDTSEYELTRTGKVYIAARKYRMLIQWFGGTMRVDKDILKAVESLLAAQKRASRLMQMEKCNLTGFENMTRDVWYPGLGDGNLYRFKKYRHFAGPVNLGVRITDELTATFHDTYSASRTDLKMATADCDQLKSIEELILEFNNICDQGKEALENNDESTAEKLIAQANQIAINTEALRQLEEESRNTVSADDQQDFHLSHIDAGALMDAKKRWQRLKTDLDERSTFVEQFQRLKANYEEISRELRQVAHDLDRVTELITASKSEVESNDSDQLLTQDYDDREWYSTSTDVSYHSSCLSRNPLGGHLGEQRPPWWLGEDGFEEMTQQWLETDENGRHIMASLEAGGIFNHSGSNVVHKMRSRPPLLSCRQNREIAEEQLCFEGRAELPAEA